MAAGSDQDAAERADVGEIPAQRYGNVSFPRQKVVGGVEVNPTRVAAPELDPSVRSVRAEQPGLARRWGGFEIAANVAGGQAESAETGDLKMSEVLANAATLLEHLFQRGSNGGRVGIELKVLVDSVHQIDSGLKHRPSRWKTDTAVLGKVGCESNEG